ncbi:hypothetical protein F66182_9399 [Fusarium sp. NRRL 66182]|nr:hypothetical protein F66182_9399 [Fusarium sp. NRRL 66182]
MLVFAQMHATHLSNPLEQVKIMRIGNLLTMFATVCFLSVCFPTAEVYIHPWLDMVEGLALGSFFLLLCDYVSPHSEQRDVFFATKRKNGIRWFKTRLFLIFQMPLVAFLVAIATTITQAVGVYCQWSNAPRFANIWLRVILTVSLVSSVIAILQFYMLLKVDLAKHRPLAKLTAFKLVVGLTLLQEVVFMILTTQDVLGESRTLTYADVHIGIPNLLICIELIPFSLFFVWAYPWSVYKDGDGRGNFSKLDQAVKPTNAYQGGPFGIRAWLAMLNPSDNLRAIAFVVSQSSRPRRSRVAVGSYGSQEVLYSNSYQMPSQEPSRETRDGYLQHA